MNFCDSWHEQALDLLLDALMRVDQIAPFGTRRSIGGTTMRPWNGAWDQRFFELHRPYVIYLGLVNTESRALEAHERER
jgi:hypothetical protein